MYDDSFDGIIVGAYYLFRIAAVLIAIVMLVITFWRPINKASEVRTEVIVVTDKMVKNDRYLIYASDNVYEITDSWLMGRFDSSDLYGKIEVGKTYKVKVGGKRDHFLSVYPCIHEVEEVKEE